MDARVNKSWWIVYGLIFGIMLSLIVLINGVERRRAQETMMPTPKTTLIPPVTTTPSAP